MKKFESLGKSLSKKEMSLLFGGVLETRVNCLVGWRLDPNQGCFCDIYGIVSPDKVECDVPCPDTMCNEGSIDYSCPYFN